MIRFIRTLVWILFGILTVAGCVVMLPFMALAAIFTFGKIGYLIDKIKKQ